MYLNIFIPFEGEIILKTAVARPKTQSSQRAIAKALSMLGMHFGCSQQGVMSVKGKWAFEKKEDV